MALETDSIILHSDIMDLKGKEIKIAAGRPFYAVLISIFLSTLGMMLLNNYIFPIPILQSVLGFVFIAFVPGVLILKILNVSKIGFVRFIAYSVGLSLSYTLFIGLIISVLLPLIGITHPFSEAAIVLSLSIGYIILVLIDYLRQHQLIVYVNVSGNKNVYIYSLLIPLVTIIGSQTVCFPLNPILIPMSITGILFILLLFSMTREIDKNHYPLIIYVVGLTLIYSHSLIFESLIEFGDGFFEWKWSNLILSQQVWDPTIIGNLNSCLSLTVLIPILSIVMNLPSVWVIKAICPIIYAIVPVILYEIYATVTKNDKIAFLSAMFFVSMFVYFTIMIGLVRQQFAELFLCLLLLLMVDRHMSQLNRNLLIILFSIAIVFSHYAIASIFLLILIGCALTVLFLRIIRPCVLSSKFKSIQHIKNNDSEQLRPNKVNFQLILSKYIFFYMIIVIAYAILVTQSSTFNALVLIGKSIVSGMDLGFINPETTQSLALVQAIPKEMIDKIYKMLQIVPVCLISVGVIRDLIKPETEVLNQEYRIFSLQAFLLCVACFGLPYFAATINTSRMYHISLIFLAPYCIIGGTFIIKRLGGMISNNFPQKKSLQIMTIFLIIFIPFNSGLIYERPGEIDPIQSPPDISNRPHFYQSEFIAASWMSSNIDSSDQTIYTDTFNTYLLNYAGAPYRFIVGDNNIEINYEDVSYLYFGKNNLVNHRVWVSAPGEDVRQAFASVSIDSTTTSKIDLNMNTLYDNGDANVYKK
ncbi:MAG: DUF2206 domain-containing protein [Methanomicrobiaceae archaeon]|nr:DUF2206 domain-containing protein [Methanomicrobiaceae archaeon]